MISDRSYTRNAGQRDARRTSALAWLLCAIGAGFVLQFFFERLIPGAASIPREAAALMPDSIARGRVWTLFSHALLHGGLLHVFANSLVIYFMGRETLPRLGNWRFGLFCAAAAACGGLAWLLVNFRDTHAALIGASGIATALLVLFACFYPNNKITVLLFFILPLTIRPKYLALAVAAFDFLGMLFYEIPGYRDGINVAFSAHLGGMAAAVAYYFLIHNPVWLRSGAGAPSPRPGKKPAAIAAPKYKVNITSRDDLRTEVDRILDKINAQGFASLTDEEKRTLDSARDMLSESRK